MGRLWPARHVANLMPNKGGWRAWGVSIGVKEGRLFVCPDCRVSLEKVKGPAGVFWLCRACRGRSATISLLRKQVPREWVNTLWQAARADGLRRKRPCPACDKPMVSLPARVPDGVQHLDVCIVCQSVWFDSDEYEALPIKHEETVTEKTLSPAAREKIALLEVAAIRDAAERDHSDANAPDEWWQWIPAALGMPVEHDAGSFSRLPWVTWVLTLLICAISVVAFMDRANWIQQCVVPGASGRRHHGIPLLADEQERVGRICDLVRT